MRHRGAAKEGLTLTTANHAIFYDRSFSLDDYLQAQDRIHRISQTRDCYIHILIARDTIDEWVDVLLTAKYRAAQLAQGDIDTVAFHNSFRSDVSEILRAVLFPDGSTTRAPRPATGQRHSPMKSDETTIAIMGKHVPARHERIAIDKLLFLPDNPRVYAAMREMPDSAELTPEEEQVRIYERLLREPSVKKLEPEIKRDGGLQDPITVRIDTHKVIEGNSRLAVYRKLWDETADDQWAHIRCLTVTKLTDDQQTRLLGQAHLRGRTEWSRYAQALFCFSWVEEDKKDIATLARLVRLYRRRNQEERQDHLPDGG